MAENLPRLRSDLEIRAESAEQTSSVIVKDPKARRFYRFTPVQAAALRKLDGTQAPDSIAAEVSQNHQVEVTGAWNVGSGSDVAAAGSVGGTCRSST